MVRVIVALVLPLNLSSSATALPYRICAVSLGPFWTEGPGRLAPADPPAQGGRLLKILQIGLFSTTFRVTHLGAAADLSAT
ncbi:MAG: hypothetical protein Q7T55_04695 [Solirubrobacteraceae bacterium]|nr:hypothetical protein [Solirubrobacteraceae bacterium]